MRIKDILSFLCCPDDRSSLKWYPDYLSCPECGRQYPVLGDDFVELLPVAMHPQNGVNLSYPDLYKKDFRQKFTWMEGAAAWGRCDLAHASWAAKRLKQVEFTKKLLLRTPVICDVSAGAGTYTFELAKEFQLVIHCDLSVENLNDVYQRKNKMAVNNLILIRCDYFKLPFFNTLPQLICTDTLIRGQCHEKAVLASLTAALAKGGHALVDFHNWWHNPLRRMGLMRNNFSDNTSYTRKAAEKILSDSGIASWRFYPFIQEQLAEQYQILKKIIPPARLMYGFTKQ
ncbi:MAG: hypothetical protein MI863_20125 [Desulfobacterales bacterium]|nr:hypothetical protein [Desulfobacterales bacterium]